jgi:hypothetical protein
VDFGEPPSGTFVNKDKKDRKRRGIVAQTPASSERHQALASKSSRSPKARARCYSSPPILEPLTLQRSHSAPSVLKRHNHSGRTAVASG